MKHGEPGASAVKHCDDYIHDLCAAQPLRWFLFVHRLPAIDQQLCRAHGVNPALFADYQGKRVRVVMASRLGDVGITEHLEAEDGYQARVTVEELMNFSATPGDPVKLAARDPEAEFDERCRIALAAFKGDSAKFNEATREIVKERPGITMVEFVERADRARVANNDAGWARVRRIADEG